MSDNFNAFQEKYPNLFNQYPRCGFDLPSGWEKLLHKLCFLLEQEIESFPEDNRKDYKCSQVKEKFGGLRFYMEKSNDYMNGMIHLAENVSYSMCEVCGNAGKLRKGGWMRTLCDNHVSQ